MGKSILSQNVCHTVCLGDQCSPKNSAHGPCVMCCHCPGYGNPERCGEAKIRQIPAINLLASSSGFLGCVIGAIMTRVLEHKNIVIVPSKQLQGLSAVDTHSLPQPPSALRISQEKVCCPVRRRPFASLRTLTSHGDTAPATPGALGSTVQTGHGHEASGGVRSGFRMTSE